jgi:uncharacterized delta-60 repeat protein
MFHIRSILTFLVLGIFLAACSQVAEVPQEETPQLESAATTPGSLDPTFKKTLQGFTTESGGFATHMAALPNGKAIVVFELWDGKIGAPGFQQFIVVRRYNEDGSLDRTFGGPGNIQATIRGFSPNLTPDDLLVTPEGRIFIAATGRSVSSTRALIFALTPSGTFDSSFAGDGSLSPATTIANPSTNDISAADLSYDPATKKLTLGGTIEPKSGGNNFLWTYTVDVNNTNFPKETTVKETGTNLELAKLEKLPNGEMVLAAGITPSSGDGLPRSYLVRQLDNGLIVGKAINGVGFETFITGLKVDGNKVFLAGSAFTSGFSIQGYVARFNLETLAKDTTFGSNGIRLVGNEVRDIAFSNGTGTAKKILVAGTDGTDYLVARMSYNGQMDNAFGKNGIALVNFSNAVDERALTLSVDSKNRIWSAGLTESFNNSGFRAGIFRLLP